jgi:hypothetical protein
VTSDLGCSRKEWRWDTQWRRKRENLGRRATVRTNVVLVGSELSAFSRDSLEIFLSWSIGIANLEKQAFLTDGLTMEFLDDFFADVTVLKPTAAVSLESNSNSGVMLTGQNPHRGCCSDCPEGFCLN